MIVLSETTDILQLILGGAVTASELEVGCSWRDITTTLYTPGRTLSVSNGANDVDIVPAPGASTKRVVDFINVYNKDSANATVTIKYDANGTEYILWKGVLEPEQVLTYCEGRGWELIEGFRPVQTFVVHADAGANFAMTNATQAERFAGNSSRHLFLADLAGYKQVRLITAVMVGSASVNTPKFRAKYYTSYNTTVGNFLTLGASEIEVSVVNAGYQDTGWINLVAGAKITGACIGFTEVGGDGVADPALGSTIIMFR